MKIRPFYVIPFLLMFGVFLWQFLVGLVAGKEAGFLLYAVVGLVPLIVLGFPWFAMLTPEGNLDIAEELHQGSAVKSDATRNP